MDFGALQITIKFQYRTAKIGFLKIVTKRGPLGRPPPLLNSIVARSLNPLGRGSFFNSVLGYSNVLHFIHYLPHILIHSCELNATVITN